MESLTTLLFTSSGRINRARYWLAVVIYIGTTIIGVALAATTVWLGLLTPIVGYLLIFTVIYVPMVVSSVMVGVKRLHDRDKSGWWLLLFYLLPAVLGSVPDGVPGSLIFLLASFAVSIWALVEIGFLRGTAGPNRYGPDPLAS